MRKQVLNNEIELVSQWLSQGMEVNIEYREYEEYKTALDYALGANLLDMACILLRHGGVSSNIELLNSSLIYAASNRHYHAVNLLSGVPGVDINFQNEGQDRKTALILAVENNDITMGTYLLHAQGINTNINIQDSEGKTALMYAVLNNNSSMITQLLEIQGVYTNIQDFEGKTALMHAVQISNIGIVKQLLLALGREHNAPDENGKTALMFAAEEGNVGMVAQLLGKIKTAVAILDQANKTVFKYADENGNANMKDQLEDALGLNTDVADQSGKTALMYAAESGHSNVIEELLAVPGIDINLQDNSERTAFDLYNFTSAKDAKVLELFLHKQASTILRRYDNEEGRISADIMISALSKLALARNIDAIKRARALGYSLDGALVEIAKQIKIDVALPADAEQNETDKNKEAAKILIAQEPKVGGRVLVAAASSGNDSLLQKLLEVEGIGVNDQDEDGNTVLIEAAAKGHIAIVEQLIQMSGVEINVQNKDGNTALMQAAAKGHTDVIIKLLNAPDIKINLQNEEEKTALDLCTLSNAIDSKVLELFIQKRAKTTTIIPDDVMAKTLSELAGKGKVKDVKYAISFGFSLDNALTYTAKQGNVSTAKKLSAYDAKAGARVLLTAAKNGDKNVVKCLLQVPSIDINTTDEHGKTAFDLFKFTSTKDTSMLELFLQKKANRTTTIPAEIMTKALVRLAYKSESDAIRHALSLSYSIDAALISVAEKNRMPAITALLEQSPDAGNRALVSSAAAGNIAAVNVLLSLPEVTNENMALITAAEHGHADLVKELMQDPDIDVNAQVGNGETSLISAARKGHSTVVELLLSSSELEMNAKDANGRTILDHALEAKRLDTVCLLLKKGVIATDIELLNSAWLHAASVGHSKAVNELLSVPGIDVNFQTALMLASQGGHIPVITKLLEKGAKIDAKSNYGWMALMIASRNGHAAVVTQLLEKGAEIDAQDNSGATALMIASGSGHTAVVTQLLEKGAEINASNYNGLTALMIASGSGHAAVVTQLLGKGADSSYKEDGRLSALLLASTNGYAAISRQLLSASGVDISTNGNARLILAAMEGNIDKALSLLKLAQVCINSKDILNTTALIVAATNGHAGLVEKLLSKDANIDDHNMYGLTALMMASGSGHTAVVTQLLEKGADIEVKEVGGCTALIIAAQKNHASVITQLLEKGADIEVREGGGCTALIIAAQKNHASVITQLLEKGAKIDAQDHVGGTALMYASRKNHTSVITHLLAKSANIEAKNDNSWTALMIASYYDHKAVVIQLLEKSANVDAKNDNGWTALMIASIKGHTLVVTQLLAAGADVHAKDNDEKTAIDFLEFNDAGNTSALEVLLKAGAKPKKRISDEIMTKALNGLASKKESAAIKHVLSIGYSLDAALRISAENGKVPVAQVLLEQDKGAGSRALLSAAKEGKGALVKNIIAAGADASAKNIEGKTAFELFNFSDAEDATVLELFLKKGMSTQENIPGNIITAALIAAARNDDYVIVQKLLEMPGTDINAQGQNGNTALIVAASGGYSAIVNKLLQMPGIEVFGINKQGKSALDLFTLSSIEDLPILEIFLRKYTEAGINIPDKIRATTRRITLLANRANNIPFVNNSISLNTVIAMPKNIWTAFLTKAVRYAQAEGGFNSYMFMYLLLFRNNVGPRLSKLSFELKSILLSFLTQEDFGFGMSELSAIEPTLLTQTELASSFNMSPANGAAIAADIMVNESASTDEHNLTQSTAGAIGKDLVGENANKIDKAQNSTAEQSDSHAAVPATNLSPRMAEENTSIVQPAKAAEFTRYVVGKDVSHELVYFKVGKKMAGYPSSSDSDDNKSNSDRPLGSK